ncbi:restriction endonuclease subunit S [Aliarcobacter butzleri]|jgi:type I restriction enzyme S subunit|uniref:restriction endonuclease subunit S n=1 Tax=Aliarcobacter butzleri TaxID=28197 RepID=UPI001260BAF1|nr:restriction endonuclease subunit S [Aliarcobacter butzleri]MDN5125506.1 restriction endonuclease subunit S [Aliarcobacter butzleri]
MKYRIREQNELKPSGVEWLGDIPKKWQFTRLKYCFTYKKGKNPDIIFDENFDNKLLPYLSTEYLRKGTNIQYVDNQNRNYLIANFGDILLLWDGANAGEFFISKEGIVSSTMALLKKINQNDIDLFFKYFLKSIEKYLRSSTTGMGIPHINSQILNNLTLILPNIVEQQKIANFLDEKSKIFDEAISKKEQLISKLELVKQSLISEVVTGKLKIVEQNSKLQTIKREENELKSSGVEWLGDIPKDWKIHKLRYGVERIGDIDHDMPKSVSIGKPYLMTGDISEKVSLIDFSNTKQISEEDFLRLSRKIKPNKGDIIFARYATIGTVCYVDVEKDFLVSYSCVTIKTIPKKVFGEYLFYFFKSNFFLEEIKSYINSNTQGNIGIDSLYKIKLILPKIEEQQKISKYLDEKLIHFDNTIEKTKQSIKKLKEAKEALISQAVTGKIEVL